VPDPTKGRLLSRAANWLRADPGAFFVVSSGSGAPVAPIETSPELDSLVGCWRRRLARTRLLVGARRAATVALAVLVPVELAQALGGVTRETRGATLAAATVVFLVLIVLQARRPVSPRDTAFLLDRRLGLADVVSTALELPPGTPSRLRALVTADARRALAGTLATSRVDARGGARDWLLFAGAIAALAVASAVPATSGNGGASRSASSPSAQPGPAALPALRGFASPPQAPPPRRKRDVTAVSPGTGRTGALTGHSPYGGGIASKHPAADIAPARALPEGAKGHNAGPDRGAGDATEGRAGRHSSPDSTQPGNAADLGEGSGGSVQALGPTQSGAGRTAQVKAGSSTGRARGGAGAAGTARGAHGGAVRGTAGGASAGAARGRAAAGRGLVPVLGFGVRLPIVGGFEGVRDTGGRTSGSTGTAGSSGGTARSATAAGRARGGGGYVPTGAVTGFTERALLLAFFAGAKAQTPSHW